MAAAEGVSTAESDDFLVVEAHASEDLPQVILLLAGIWQTSIRCACNGFGVSASRSVWDGWALHLLNTSDTSEDPEIRIGDPWELLCTIDMLAGVRFREVDILTLDWLQEVPGSFETGIGAVVGFGGKSHGCTIAASGLGVRVVSSRSMPGQSDEDWSIAAIIIIILILELLRHSLVYLLVVLVGWGKWTLGVTGGQVALLPEV